jgi:hypothetical protein
MFDKFYNHVVDRIKEHLGSSGLTNKFFEAHPQVEAIEFRTEETDDKIRYVKIFMCVKEGKAYTLSIDDQTEDQFATAFPDHNYSVVDWDYVREVERLMCMIPMIVSIDRDDPDICMEFDEEQELDIIIPNGYFVNNTF